jgi:hypothetical protein
MSLIMRIYKLISPTIFFLFIITLTSKIISLQESSLLNTLAKSISKERMDITARYIYEKHKLLGVQSDWSKKLYRSIQTLTTKSQNCSLQELRNAGISEDHLDALALQYVRLKKNTYIAVVWPACQKATDQELINILEKYGSVVYWKHLTFKNEAGKRFLYTVPEKKRTVEKHYYNYFPRDLDATIRVFLFEGTVEDVTKAKKEARYTFNLYPWAMHVNDFHHQTVEAAEIFFNNNSIHFYNHAKRALPPKVQKLFKNFKKLRFKSGINKEYFCIDGSAILAFYGIRDVNIDFDFLFHGPSSKLPSYLKKWPIDHHNQVWKKLHYSIDEIIFNPKHYFFFQGFKCVNLNTLAEFKKKQGRKRDILDIQLIKQFLQK